MKTNSNGKGDAPRQGNNQAAYSSAWGKIFGDNRKDMTCYLPEFAQESNYAAYLDEQDEFLWVEDHSGREWDSWLGVASEEAAVYILQQLQVEN